MRVNDFPQINLPESGSYRLVKENLLEELLVNSSSLLLQALKKGPWKYGDVLKLFREARGLSQQDLADKLKVERKTIWLIEKHKTGSPHDDTHKDLIAIFGPTFDNILKLLKLI